MDWRASLDWLLLRSLEAETDAIRRARLALTDRERHRLARLIRDGRREQAALRELVAQDE